MRRKIGNRSGNILTKLKDTELMFCPGLMTGPMTDGPTYTSKQLTFTD